MRRYLCVARERWWRGRAAGRCSSRLGLALGQPGRPHQAAGGQRRVSRPAPHPPAGRPEPQLGRDRLTRAAIGGSSRGGAGQPDQDPITLRALIGSPGSISAGFIFCQNVARRISVMWAVFFSQMWRRLPLLCLARNGAFAACIIFCRSVRQNILP